MGKTSHDSNAQNLLGSIKLPYVTLYISMKCLCNFGVGRKMGLGINKLLSIYKDLQILDVQHAYKIKAFDDLLKNEKSIYEVYEEIKGKLSICKEKIVVFIDDVDRLRHQNWQ